MTKTELKNQIKKLVIDKEIELHAKYQRKADVLWGKYSSGFYSDETGKSIFGYVCSVRKTDDMARGIINGGVKGYFYDSTSGNRLRGLFIPVKLIFPVHLSLHFDGYYERPESIIANYKSNNSLIGQIADAYLKDVMSSNEQFKRILDIINSTTPKKAYKLLLDAGVPLVKEEEKPKNLPATQLIIDLSQIVVKKDV